MSADNGIYIGHFTNGYRVIHAQAIENIYESEANLLEYFEHSPLWDTLEDAHAHARWLLASLKREAWEDDLPFVLEHGIQILEFGEWPVERKDNTNNIDIESNAAKAEIKLDIARDKLDKAEDRWRKVGIELSKAEDEWNKARIELAEIKKRA